MSKRSASDFSREEIFTIACKYSTGTYNYDDFHKDYKCNRNTFYIILKWAIERCIVSSNIIIAMLKVSVNQAHISQNVSEEMIFKIYQSRIARSNNYQLSQKESILLVIAYSTSPLSKSEYCKEHFCTPSLLDRTIIKCIVQNWVSATIVYALRNKG